jgi:hypothetical protein
LGTLLIALLTLAAAPAPAQEAPMSDAQRIVEITYPPGSYAATFRTTMRDMATMQAGNEEVRKLDPNSAERMRITYKVIDDEAAKFGRAQEPKVREAMVAAVAAKFSPAEQRDIRAFLETPSGRAYATKMTDIADVLETSEQKAQMMVAMEELTEKIEAATAHLPPR